MKAIGLGAVLLVLAGQPAGAQVAPMPNAAPSDMITVAGLVIDEETGEPVAQVAVFLTEGSIGTLTSADGAFVLRGVPNRNAVLRTQRPGYIPEMRMVMVCEPDRYPSGECRAPAAVDQIVNFYLRPAPRTAPVPGFP